MELRVLEENKTILDWDNQVNTIYVANKWSTGLPAGKVKEIFSKSIFFLAVGNGRVCGFARGFSDDWMVTYLSDILVHPDYQRQGIGSMLLKKFTADYAHTAIYTDSLTDSVRFFARGPLTFKGTLVPFSLKPQRARKVQQ